MATQPFSSSSTAQAAVSSSLSSSLFFSQLFSLEGKCAIVTGGGTGIGAALSMGLARAGASVVLVGRREGPLLDNQRLILEQLQIDADAAAATTAAANRTAAAHSAAAADSALFQHRCVVYPCDITNLELLPQLVKDAEQLTNGRKPTIVIHNAGRNVRQPADKLEESHWNESLNLMLTAPFFLTRCLADNFRSEKYGRVVSLASLQSFRAFPDSLPYAAAKSGAMGLTRALAEVYSPYHEEFTGCDITVNAIAPGYVKTELTASVFDDRERSERLANATIVGRNSSPQDLVGACVFLASPAASYITGQILPVDGGFTALGLR